MTRARYLTWTTVTSGVLTAVGTIFWYTEGLKVDVLILGASRSLGVDSLLLLPAAVIAGADIARRAFVSVISSIGNAARHGVLVRGGAELESADLALMSGHLTAIPQALSGAKRAISVIRQNVAIAIVTVAFLFAGVLAGEVHMAGGMLIHQGSILVVIANGLRLRKG